MAATGGWLLASVLFLSRLRGVALIVGGALDAVVLLAMVGFVALVRPRVALKLRGGELFISRLRGDRRILGVGDSGRVVELDIEYGAPGNPSWRSQVWMIVMNESRVALRLNRTAWDHAELDRVRALLALPLAQIVQ
jgi:hypothetical protein